MAEHSIGQSNMKGFIQMAFEKNASAASTEIRMTIGRAFPSIVTVGTNIFLAKDIHHLILDR